MDNKDQLDSLFNKARNEAPHASFTETKGWFLNSLGSTQAVAENSTVLLTTKKWIIMLSTIGITIGMLTFILSKNTQVEQPIPETTQATIENLALATEVKNQKEINENNAPEKQVFTVLEIEQKIIENPTLIIDSLAPVVKTKSTTSVNKEDSIPPRFALPILTTDEIEAHQKEKKQLLKMWGKKSKEKCVKIPSGKYNLNGEKMDIKSFYMQRSEVSNIEYRTFINDLILEGRAEDFQIAVPKQSNWTTLEGDQFDWLKTLEGKYSVSSEYDDFPVNNVSRAAVNLYCAWLQQQLNKSSSETEGTKTTVRLPFNYEWLYAGTEGGMKKYYSWGWDQAFNQHGCYVANFYIKNDELPERCDCEILDKDAFSSFWWRTGKKLPTSPVAYYWPNKWGLLDMNGNVAEMVNYTDQNIKIGALGGGWLSNADQIKFNAPDPYVGIDQPHLNIGFRVVVE